MVKEIGRSGFENAISLLILLVNVWGRYRMKDLRLRSELEVRMAVPSGDLYKGHWTFAKYIGRLGTIGRS